MIFTRWENVVEIKAKHGVVERRTPEGEIYELNLVSTQEGDRTRYHFIENLRASGGLPEIMEALDRAPFVELDEEGLGRAKIEAM